MLLKVDINFDTQTLLHIFYFSYQHDYQNGVDFSIRKGIPFSSDNFIKILRLAARKGDCSMIQNLFSQVEADEINCESALLDALSCGHPEAALLILKNIGVLNEICRNQAVEKSSAQGYYPLLQALLANGPISKEANYWSQAAAKNPDCLRILTQAEIY